MNVERLVRDEQKGHVVVLGDERVTRTIPAEQCATVGAE
jgi:hypothetical protein